MTLATLTTDNRDAWDAFVSDQSTATAYHFSAWQFAVQRAYGHPAAGLMHKDDTGAVTGVLPLTNFRSLKGQRELCSLPFCDVGDVLASHNEVAQSLTQAARQQSKALELRTRAEAPLTADAMDSYQGKVSMLKQLDGDAEALLASFKPKLRSQIKKAQKNGLTFKRVQDASLVDDFYPAFALNMRDLGSPVHSKTWFRCIMEEYQDNAVMSVVYLDNTPIAGGIVLCGPSQACIPWASSLREYNRLAPNMLLYWSLLSFVADRGLALFDFGRSTINEGTYRFKKQWGAVPYPLVWTKYPEPTAAESQGTTGNLRKTVEALWSRLPVAVANRIGPPIRKRISL